MIVGIDEVGRGPWAGPLVVGAVILNDTKITGLTDSKKLTKPSRERLSREIIEHSESYGIGWVDANEIDDIGLSAALTLGTKRALEQITASYHEIIIDGTVNFLKDTNKGPYVTTLKKADLLIASVSAASIIAKVARDDYMAELGEQYDLYGFESHVGYGTARHREAIQQHGIMHEHRRSFAPIRAMMGLKVNTESSIDGTNKSTGNNAEAVAADWLVSNGFELVERNWATKFCEIDIIAKKHTTLYFVEVKHRKSIHQGGGIAAITPRKLRQMRFAASVYLVKHPLVDAQMAVITTNGTTLIQIEDFLLIE